MKSWLINLNFTDVYKFLDGSVNFSFLTQMYLRLYLTYYPLPVSKYGEN